MSRLLIFDWDGTLCDSLARIAQCVGLAASDVGLVPPKDEQVREIVGLGWREALGFLFPGVDFDALKQYQERYAHHFLEQDQVPSPFYPGVVETLDILIDQGCRLAVATGKSRRGMNRVLKTLGMEDYFQATRCADETASKPDPLMINELLEYFSVAPEDSIMVGDTEFDMEMAMRAGVPRIAVRYGAHDAQRLLRYQPLGCLDEFGDILSIVNQKDRRFV